MRTILLGEEDLLDGLVELRTVHGAYLYLWITLLGDEEDRRDGADAKCGGKLLLLIHVHLIYIDLSGVCLGDVLQGPHQVA